MAKLLVKPLEREDVFEDIARVHFDHRPNAKAGSVIVLKSDGKKVRAIARGAPKNDRTSICLDLSTRQKLGLKLHEKVDVEICKAGWLDEIRWAWGATNAMPRVAARLAVLSVVLGVIGLVLGIISIVG